MRICDARRRITYASGRPPMRHLLQIITLHAAINTPFVAVAQTACFVQDITPFVEMARKAEGYLYRFVG